MSVTKQSKYNWDIHLPRLVDLYLQGLSFPDIHKAAKTSNFNPSEKTVYNKLTQAGYPADKLEREEVCRKLNIARWPSEIVSKSKNQCATWPSLPASNSDHWAGEGSHKATHMGGSNCLEEQTDPRIEGNNFSSFPQHVSAAGTLNAPPGDHNRTPAHDPPDVSLLNESEWLIAQNDSYGQFFDIDMSLFGMGFPNDAPIPPSQDPRLDMNDEACDVSPRASLSQMNVSRHNPGLSQPLEGGDTLDCCEQQAFCTKVSSHPQTTLTPVDVPDLADTPSPFSTNTFPATPRYPGGAVTSNSKPRQLDRWNPRFRASKVINPDRNSTSTYDSGYVSGRSSPFSFQAVERQPRRITPSPPFNGLHRVACKTTHEPRKYNIAFSPQPINRYREVPTCQYCKYSAIHNLCWSAQYLKFEVVATELKLPETYEVTAVDAAGNSALHYAAIGGAGLEVIVTLIDAGVDPCQINTSGELFLHCLLPHFDQCQLTFEEYVFPTFRTNLVNLLNCLDLRCNGFFRWRDNTGRTALEKFVLNIGDNDLRLRIRDTVSSAGYPLLTLDGPRNDQLSFRLYTFVDTSIEGTFDFNKVRQRIAKEITRHASTDPTFVHPETGDNILHALARLRSQESADLISRIRHFASKEVDLNLRNFDQDGPLSTFTQEPPADGVTSEETGATISKYLDALLWKDPQKRIPNKINVNMRNLEGATPLYYAAIRARPDSVRSLIEAGANVNAILEINGRKTSILLASEKEKDKAYLDKNLVKFDRMNNVISYLEHANAVIDPTEVKERFVCDNTVGSIGA